MSDLIILNDTHYFVPVFSNTAGQCIEAYQWVLNPNPLRALVRAWRSPCQAKYR
jgi:hypothetical protein